MPCLQVHELTNALTLCRSDVSSAESEVLRLKELHSQVKAALQDSYTTQQDQQRQVRHQTLRHPAGCVGLARQTGWVCNHMQPSCKVHLGMRHIGQQRQSVQ